MDRKYVVVGMSNCKYCRMAIDLLTRKEQQFEYFNITEHAVMKVFLQSCGLSTVPQIFLNGHLIGGYESLETLLQ